MLSAVRLCGLLPGPYKNEADFKRAFLSRVREVITSFTFYEIENEKEEGMPDILAMSYSSPAHFIELKYIRADGLVKFRPLQPLWYKRNTDVRVKLVAWDSRTESVVLLSVERVVLEKSRNIPVEKCRQDIGIQFTRGWLHDF